MGVFLRSCGMGFLLLWVMALTFLGCGAGEVDGPLAVGTRAPNFDLLATYGRQVALGDYAGKNLIIIFYPMDDTPGCTVQLCALRDEYPTFEELNAEGIASNPNTVASHEAFADKQQYLFPILADEDKAMALDYRVLGSGGFVERTVYIVDGDGIIRYAKRGMPSNDELREALQSMSPSTTP